MPTDVTVATNPVVVYGMIGLLIGALALALYLSRPRRGLGTATHEDAARMAPGHGPWMPGGDIFGHDEPPAAPPDELPTYPNFPSANPGPESPPAHDPGSTLTSDQAPQQPRWDKP